jgi:endonuclease/exonuclease/phosphatase family metal-dependent hydrolase
MSSIRHLRLATWNVNRAVAAARVVGVHAALEAVGADIVVLTETHDGLKPRYGHAVASLPGRDGRHGDLHRWVSIHSRFPLHQLPTSDAHRTVAVRVSVTGGNLLVIGTVLPWKGSSWRNFGPREAFPAALRLQMDDITRIQAAFPEDALFMAGDFNQDLCGSRYAGTLANERLLRAVLHGAGLVAVTGGANGPVRQACPEYACIDHICIPGNRDWAVGDVRCWPGSRSGLAGLSDHFGVVYNLTRKWNCFRARARP